MPPMIDVGPVLVETESVKLYREAPHPHGPYPERVKTKSVSLVFRAHDNMRGMQKILTYLKFRLSSYHFLGISASLPPIEGYQESEIDLDINELDKLIAGLSSMRQELEIYKKARESGECTTPWIGDYSY